MLFSAIAASAVRSFVKLSFKLVFVVLNCSSKYNSVKLTSLETSNTFLVASDLYSTLFNAGNTSSKILL